MTNPTATPSSEQILDLFSVDMDEASPTFSPHCDSARVALHDTSMVDARAFVGTLFCSDCDRETPINFQIEVIAEVCDD